MEHFIYQHGDRPLDGYTIQRAAGRGGFGEVYYAISDSGREVALKAVNNYETIELRGITQCMNLKSPHLVSIFDVKYNEANKPFVLMEYVSGPSLRDLIDQSPNGLGEQKSAFFLREIAKGLSYLHECGIVHRDLKPGNIFYENGYVKIGDYGLSKAIKHGYNSNQTITVGTVHYMAPEIGAGNYDSSIDIYALGCMLYEMLTGNVPFFGNSPGEVLMKHVSSEPDLTGIDVTFARVIRKALAKDPNERYASVQEMVEDAFGQDHIKNSVSQFRADDLSMIAGQVAEKIKQRQTVQTRQMPKEPSSPEKPAVSNKHKSEDVKDFTTPDQMEEIVVSPEKAYRIKVRKYDRFSPFGRFFASLVPVILMTIAFAFLISGINTSPWGIGGEDKGMLIVCLAVMQLGALGGFFTGNRLISSKTTDPVLKNFARIVPAILLANLLLFPGYIDDPESFGPLVGMPSCALILLALMEKQKHNLLSPMRKKHIELGYTIGMSFFIFFLSVFIPRIVGIDFNTIQLYFAICLFAGVSLSIQMLSPFIDPADREAFEADTTDYTIVAKRNMCHDSRGLALQPDWLKGIWRTVAGLLITLSIFMFFIAGQSSYGNDLAVSFGIGAFVLFIFSLKQSLGKYYLGLGKSLIKPLLLLISFAAAYAGFFGILIQGDTAFLILFAIPGALVFWVVLFMPARIFDTASDKSGHMFKKYAEEKRKQYPNNNLMPKPDWLKAVWYSLCSILLSVMLILYVSIGFVRDEDVFISLAIALTILFVYSLFPTFSSVYRGLGKSLIKPLMLMLFYGMAHFGLTMVACYDIEEFTALAVPSIILFFVVLFMPGRTFDTAAEKSARFATSAFKHVDRPSSLKISPLKRGVALLLCFVPIVFGGFVGLNGLQRFYVGRIGTGILWFLTGGLFGIGQLIDIIMIISGSFTDKNDKPLKLWWDEEVKAEYYKSNADKQSENPQKSRNFKDEVMHDVKSTVEDIKESVRTVAAVAKEKSATVKQTVSDPDFIEERKQNGEFFSRGSNYSVYKEPIRPGAALLRVLGFMFFVISFVIGIVWAIGLPTIFSIIPEISQELKGEFGPRVFDYIDTVLVIVLVPGFIFSIFFTSLGRKHNGGMHLIRGILAIGLLVPVLTIWKSRSFEGLLGNSHLYIQSGNKVQDILNLIIDSQFHRSNMYQPTLVLVFIVLAIIFYVWPAKKYQPQQFEHVFREQ